MPPWIYTVLGRRWFRINERNGGSENQSRRWSYGRVKRAAVRRLFFLGRRPAVDYVDYIERKIAIPQKTESAESVPGY